MEDLNAQPTMTLEQARTVGRPAFWVGPSEEFMFDPGTGATFWHAFLEESKRPGYMWGTVPRDKQIPESGWIHWPDPPCGCEFCSRTEEA